VSPAAPAGDVGNNSRPPDWEARYQAGDMPWEKGGAAPPLVDWLGRNSISGRILVPGCGSGHDVRALATAGAEPIGIDIAPSAITRAETHPRAGTERYRIENLFHLPPELSGVFDVVFEHTCFCAIEPLRRPDYVSAIVAALKPEGRVLAIFYLDPGHDHPGEGPPFGVTREELDTLFLPHFELVDEYVPAVSYPGREGREILRVLQRVL
jgi:methyl halide transferase